MAHHENKREAYAASREYARRDSTVSLRGQYATARRIMKRAETRRERRDSDYRRAPISALIYNWE